MSIYSTDQSDNRVGVVNFGTNAPVENAIELASVSDNANSIKSRISIMDMSNTNFLAAFKTAKTLFSNANSFEGNRQPAIVLFTDGEPDDGVRKGASLFPDIIKFAKDNFINNNCPIFVVAIDNFDEYWSKSEKYWKSIPSTAYKISSMNDLQSTFHHIIADIVGFGWEKIPTPTAGNPAEVEVKPYLERVTFTILKELPDVKLKILNPKGDVVSNNDENVVYKTGEKNKQFESYSIIDPKPGIWKLELEGKGNVQIFKDELTLSTEIVEPTSPYPVKRPMNVAINISRRDGAEFKPIPEYPIHSNLIITTPNSSKPRYVELMQDPSNHNSYKIDKQISIDEIGVYNINVVFKTINYVIFEKNFPVTVDKLPYLEIVHPSESIIPLRSKLRFESRLMFDGKPASVEKYFSEDPAGVALFKLQKAPGLKNAIIDFMKPIETKTGTNFVYNVNHPDLLGAYTFSVGLNGKMKDIKNYSSVIETRTFIKERTILDKISLLWPIFIGLGIVSVVLLVTGYLKLPELRGQIEIGEPYCNEVRLRGKRVLFGETSANNFGIGGSINKQLGYIKGVPSKDEYERKIIIPSIFMYNSPKESAKNRKNIIVASIIYIIGAILAGLYDWTLLVLWTGLSLILSSLFIYLHYNLVRNKGSIEPNGIKSINYENNEISFTYYDI